MSVGSLLVYTVTIVSAENPKDDYLQPPPPRSFKHMAARSAIDACLRKLAIHNVILLTTAFRLDGWLRHAPAGIRNAPLIC